MFTRIILIAGHFLQYFVRSFLVVLKFVGQICLGLEFVESLVIC